MATDLGQLVYTLTLNDEGFQGQLSGASAKVKESSGQMSGSLKETEEQSGKTGGAFSSMAGQFVAGAAIFTIAQKALSLLTSTVKDGVKNFEQWQQNQAQINNSLKMTGDASGQTSKSLNDYADKLSSQTGITGNAINSAQLLMLNYKSIGKDIFPQATQTIADMATVMSGGAVPSAEAMTHAAAALGKALEDPTKATMLLRQAHIGLTPQQLATIKEMEKTGDLAGAQKQLLSDVADVIGGKAVTASHTLAGEQARLHVEMEKLEIEIGQKLTAAFKAIEPYLAKFLDFVMKHKVVLVGLLAAIGGVVIAIGVTLVAALITFIGTAGVAIATLGIIIGVAAVVGVVAYEIITHWKDLKQWFDDFMKWFKRNWTDFLLIFGPLGLLAKEIITHWKDVKQWFNDFIHDMEIGIDVIKRAWDRGWADIKQAVVDVVHFFVRVWQDIEPGLKAVGEVILAILLLPLVPFVLAWRRFGSDIVQFFTDAIDEVIIIWSAIVGFFTTVIDAIKRVFSTIANFIVGIFKREWDGLVNTWNAVVGFFDWVWNMIRAPFMKIVGFIVGIFQREWNGIVNVFNAVSGYFNQVKNWIMGVFSSAGNWLYDVGKNIIEGLIKGVESMAGAAGKAVENVGKDIQNTAKKILKIFSPSAVFADIGKNVSLGLAGGIVSGSTQAVEATKQMTQSVVSAGASVPNVSNITSSSTNSPVTYNFGQGSVVLSTPDAVNTFFKIGNRNIQLESMGGSPLAGTTGI